MVWFWTLRITPFPRFIYSFYFFSLQLDTRKCCIQMDISDVFFFHFPFSSFYLKDILYHLQTILYRFFFLIWINKSFPKGHSTGTKTPKIDFQLLIEYWINDKAMINCIYFLKWTIIKSWIFLKNKQNCLFIYFSFRYICSHHSSYLVVFTFIETLSTSLRIWFVLLAFILNY